MAMKIQRRHFLRNLGHIAGATFLGQMARARSVDAFLPPPPAQSGIQHIVVVMMENRSFDHLLGWLPRARGRQAGLIYTDSNGIPHATHRLRHDYKGCGHPDPDHSYEGGRIQYNAGLMDGFLRSGLNDTFAIGYYSARDRPFYSSLALNYTTLDRYFCSFLGPTFPNRIFQHAAQTDRLYNAPVLSTLPTIWDRLIEAGVEARYYFSNLPFLGLWGFKYLPLAAPYEQFLADAAAGTLPAVAFVDPLFTLDDGTISNDDHPHADIRAGDAFLSKTFRALAHGPGWQGTVFVVNYDEWGGFFDHVPPPRAEAPNGVDPDLIDGKALLGFRVPTVVASPFTRGNPFWPRVKRMTFDHTSVLKLIEWRWGLQPLTARDASTDVRNLVQALDFSAPVTAVPALPDPPPPLPQACPPAASIVESEENAWTELLQSGLLDGWPLSL